MVHTPLLPLILLLVHTNSATLDDVDEGSGIAVDSSRISGSAIMENDRKITEPFLSSPPITASKAKNTIHYATTVTEDAFSNRVHIEQADDINPLTTDMKIEKRDMATSSNR